MEAGPRDTAQGTEPLTVESGEPEQDENRLIPDGPDEISPKQTVRNVESALIAHLGMRVSHKKISVATSSEGRAIPSTPVAPKTEASKPLHPPSISNLSPSPQASVTAPSSISARATPPQSMPHVTTPSS